MVAASSSGACLLLGSCHSPTPTPLLALSYWLVPSSKAKDARAVLLVPSSRVSSGGAPCALLLSTCYSPAAPSPLVLLLLVSSCYLLSYSCYCCSC